MDRVFHKARINDICDDLKDIVKECKDHLEDIKDTANEANSAAAKVPSEASSGAVTSATGSFTSAAGDIDFQSLTTKLSNCKTRVGMIVSQDKSYGTDTDSIKAQINTIKQVLAQMEGFMGKTSLRVNYADFMASLETASTQWQKDLDDAKQAVDQVKANMKGAETISTIFSKDPVNLSTGNFIYDRTDLQIEGSMPFIFRRFYNAINDRAGSLGDDWNHNYEVKLEDAGKEKVLVLEEGKEERFLKTSTGIYTSLYHSNGSLAETEEGYLYKTTAQTDYFFDKEGYYLRQEEPNGSVTTLHYEDADNGRHLVRIERSTGEAFSLSYTAEGYLHQVTDHSGRTVTYQMQGAKLIGVCTPKGHWYRYGYSINGKLESVQNPREVITVENTYDEQRRTVHQTFPDGGSMSYEYDDEDRAVILTERNGSKVTYIHDDKYRDVRHIYRNGEERFEYNKLNQKTLVIDKAGNKTQYGYDEKGNLTRVINALGTKVELMYDGNNQPIHIGVNGNTKVRNRYDAAGNLIETTDALGNAYQIEYQKKGRAGRIHQPDGSILEMVYDNRGNITELTDASGSISRYLYDALNRVSKAIDGNGNETSYAYDEEDNIISVTNANGDIRRYEYNESNKVTRIIDFDGSETRREYNVLNRPSKVINPAGRETVLSYDPMWNLARVTEPNGAKTTFLYNEDNLLGRIRNANGNVIRYEYDVTGNRTRIVDEEGNETFFAYDAVGQLIEVRGAEGSEISYVYDAEGNVTKVTDALGNEVILSYDENGNLLREIGPAGEERNYTYTGLGMVASITDEAGRKTRYSYEAGGRVKEILYPDGTKETYTYDGNGNVKIYTDRRGYILSYIYDSLNQIIKIEGRAPEEETQGEIKEYTYDSIGNVISMTDGAGNKTVYEYTLIGQLKKVIDALGNKTEYSYDVCDHLIEIRQYGEVSAGEETNGIDNDLIRVQEQNQNGEHCLVTRYERDLSGQIIAITDALGQMETYRYSKKGELIEKVDREGYLTRYGYNARGDVKQIQYADGREVKLSYNPLRQLQKIEDWIGTTKIENDAAGRATNIRYPDGSEISYSYGIAGERKSITYPDGKTVHYGYDEHIRLSELKDGDRIITYGYDQMGDLVHKQFPNGMETSYQYNGKGQLTGLIHKDQEGILDAYRYGYDNLGNKISIEKQRRGLKEESGGYGYGYDALGRLTEVRKEGILKSAYTYDAFGNRFGKLDVDTADGERETTYLYNALNQLIKKVDIEGEEVYTYDRRGNLSQIVKNGQVRNEYLYGVLNRLEEARNHKGEVAWYSYNGLGHRIGKQTGSIEDMHPLRGAQQVQTESSLDPMNQLREQYFVPTGKIDYTIDLTRQYHNLLQSREEGLERSQTQTYLWDGNAASVYTEENQKTGGIRASGIISYDYYLQDDLGSPIRLVDESRVLREVYEYDEFGQDLYKQEESHLQPLGYTGYQRDSVTGTCFAQAREYRANEGRFSGRDIIKGNKVYPLTMNEYTYCFNSPLNLVDLDGLWPSWNDIKSGAKNAWNTVSNGVKKAVKKAGKAIGDFYNDNKVLINGVATIAGAVSIAAITVATGGLGAVATAAIVGASVGVSATAVGDIVVGKTSSIETYLGSALGGAIGGVLGVPAAAKAIGAASVLTTPFAIGAINGGISTLTTDILEKITGTKNRGVGEIIADTAESSLLGGILGWLSDKIKVTGVNKGRNSFSAIFWSGIRKLANGTPYTMSLKTMFKAWVSQMLPSIFEELMKKIFDKGVNAIEECIE